MDTKLFVMTHKEIPEIPDPIYIPLQVGRYGKADLGYLGDDTGDHISQKNESYCELTGMYWLWKNMKCDIIGICHYRRFFWKNEKLLGQKDIEETLKSYSMILPTTGSVKEESVYAQYAARHNSRDLDICRQVIIERHPQYLQSFDFYMKTILVSVGNMWITRKDIYDRYCEWLFDILFEAEKRIDMTQYDSYQRRVMGFLSERLFRVWLLMQPEKVREEEIRLVEVGDIQIIERKNKLVSRYMTITIQPVLRLYDSGENPQPLAAPFACTDDFEGKTPVWVCWMGDVQKIPDHARMCIESIRANIPRTATFRLLTVENCMEYVTFTDTVIRKYNAGEIPEMHMAEILHAELLYRYGGMWIDVSCLAVRPIPADLLQRSLYTLRCSEDGCAESWGVSGGRWLGKLWCARPGHKLFQYLLECLWYYWEMNDRYIDDSMTDQIVEMAWQNFPDIRAELETIECSGDKFFELQGEMGKMYSNDIISRIRRDSVFYELNLQQKYDSINISGRQTVYGYLCSVFFAK